MPASARLGKIIKDFEDMQVYGAEILRRLGAQKTDHVIESGSTEYLLRKRIAKLEAELNYAIKILTAPEGTLDFDQLRYLMSAKEKLGDEDENA
jgi:deoxyribodipyrimidine photolyase-like uncharacterized protein